MRNEFRPRRGVDPMLATVCSLQARRTFLERWPRFSMEFDR